MIHLLPPLAAPANIITNARRATGLKNHSDGLV